jgi:hypothetical protein
MRCYNNTTDFARYSEQRLPISGADVCLNYTFFVSENNLANNLESKRTPTSIGLTDIEIAGNSPI